MTSVDWNTNTDPEAMLQFLQTGYRRVDDEQVGDPPPRPNDRKLRLLACACCRAVWDRLTDDAPCPKCGGSGKGQPTATGFESAWRINEWLMEQPCHTCKGTGRINRSRRAVETAERYADGKATDEELSAARTAAWNAVGREAWDAAFDGAWSVVGAAVQLPIRAATWSATEDIQCHIIRDLFAPFRPVKCRQTGNRLGTDTVMVRGDGSLAGCNCAWLTPTVLELARAAYASGNPMDPAALAVLADCLEESGCEDQYLLMHLRGWEWVNIGEHSGTRGPLPTPHYRGCHVLDALLNLE